MARKKRIVEHIKNPALRNWKPLKQAPRPENKFYVRDRLGVEVLAFEFQSVATVMYPVGSYSKEQINTAFEELKALRETLNV